jgi:hypothetical protein
MLVYPTLNNQGGTKLSTISHNIHMGHYGSNSKLGWVWQVDLFLSHTCTMGFKSVYHNALGSWRMEQLETKPLPSFNPVTWSFSYFWNKHLAYLLLHVVLSGHLIYVVFVDLTKAYIMNALYNILLYKSLSRVYRYFRDVAYLPCMYCLVKTGSSEGSVIPLDQDVHVCGNIWWLILILLCSLNKFFLYWD